MIVSLKSIIQNITKKKQGIGAFNTFNLETTQAIITASEKKKSSLIIQVTPKTINYVGLKNIYNLINNLASQTKIPLAIHLDHGKDINLIKQCIDLGFSSVHFDGSESSISKNIELTKKVVQYAKRKNVWVQGEVGVIFGKEGLIKLKEKKQKNIYLTDPLKAKEFVLKTKVDTLAISVGTLHGLFKGKEQVDYDRVKKIKKLIPQTPLVLHGASGLTLITLKKAIMAGITIFNLDTTLRIAFTNAIKKALTKKGEIIDPRYYLEEARTAIEKEVGRFLKIFKLR